MTKNMVSAELLGLESVEIDVVEREADGRWTVHVRSAAGRQACCTGCGQVAVRVKEPVVHTLKHLVLVPVCVAWHKHRFWVEVLGIDDHRRRRPLYHWDPQAHRWAADADRRQTVFVDSAGGHGLLGQAEGRAGLDAVAWLTGQDAEWRAAIRYVTIDMSTVYKSVVVKHGLLPNAALIVDLFHVVQLANKMIGDVRRRVTFERYGRRGRATDPEYVIKSVLVRGQERLSKTARHRLLCALADLGEGGR